MAYEYSSDSSAIDERIKKIKGDVYKAQAQPASLPEYDYARQKVTEAANQSNDAAQSALQRRFASMGALNSGSAIKTQQMQSDSSEQAKLSAIQGVGAQEAQAKRELAQAEANKEYQSNEAARGRAFGAEEGYVGRAFTAGEAGKQRDFQAGESLKTRDWQSGEAGKQRDWQGAENQMGRDLQFRMFNSDLEFKAWAANLQNDTALQQLAVDMYNSAYNAAVAAYDVSDDDTIQGYLDKFMSDAANKGFYSQGKNGSSAYNPPPTSRYKLSNSGAAQ